MVDMLKEFEQHKNDFVEHKADDDVRFATIAGKLDLILEKIKNVNDKLDK